MKAPPLPNPRFLILFVDASVCHRTHAAGYGTRAKKAVFEKGLIFGGRLLLAHYQRRPRPPTPV